MKNRVTETRMNSKINDTFFDNFPEIESERLIFKNFTIADATDGLSIRSDERVMKYMDTETPKTVNEFEKRIELYHTSFEEKKGITWAIVEKVSNKIIGDFGFWKIDVKHHRGEIGYVLHPEYWGKGYMKETMRALLEVGFNQLNLHSIEANVNPKNESSKKLLLNMGFKQEAYFRENYFFEGKYLDSVIYSLLESDLKK